MMDELFGPDASPNVIASTSVVAWTKAYRTQSEARRAVVVADLGISVGVMLARQAPDTEPAVEKLVEILFALFDPKNHCRADTTELLLDCSFYYSRIGKSPYGKIIAERVISISKAAQYTSTLRRAHNLLGVIQMDAADYQSSLLHLECALKYAYKLGDPLQVASCLSNAVAVLMEMGHYNDSINIALSITEIDNDHPLISTLKFQCATNGLFCSHRLHDPKRALQFLTIGNALLEKATPDALMTAIYEYNRALYLVDTFDHETAQELIEAAKRNASELGNVASNNPRVAILLLIPEALCEWASRTDTGCISARKKLRDLYEVTKKSRLYHDDVLRALMKVYGNAMDSETAKMGMRYAKELVEYTTSVKRAKFYRQLSDRGVDIDPAPPRLEVPFDPFANVRQWLTPSTNDFPEGRPADTIHGPNATKTPVAKHEELAAIHDDLARLRTEAILKEIRSVAYDTAENWALAAEFFDDQTGQHCFRVGHLAGMLAREIGLEAGYCARIEHAARLHDIGKIGVNEMILLKPGPLDPSELTAMRAHAEVGAFMLAGAKDPVLQMAAVIAKHHHEWWNGAGYPSSLADRRIPLAARICGLADVYDALTHARPYKGAWPHRVAVEEMLNLAGVQFDPHLIRPFLRVLERYVPALAAGRIPSLEHLKSNGLIASRRKLMETIGSQG